MPSEVTFYCPQCILVVFAAMGFYQYVLRDRIRNGSTSDDDQDFLDVDVDQMDESTQLLLLEMLANDHRQAEESLVVDTTRRSA